MWPKNQNIKQKQYCKKFNKDFKKWKKESLVLLRVTRAKPSGEGCGCSPTFSHRGDQV